MLRGFQYTLEPTGEQLHQLSRWAGCARYVFNRALALRQETYKATGKGIGYAATCKALTAWKRELDWLRQPPAMMLQDVDTAYNRFFSGRARYPRFRSRHHWRPSFRLPQDAGTIRVERLSASVGRLKLPKLGWIRFRWSRAPVGEIRSDTVSRDSCGDWHVSLLCRTEEAGVGEPTTIEAEHFRGLDLGIASSVTDDNGDPAQAPTPSAGDRKHAAKLARRVSRKKKGAKNREKARRRLNRFRRRQRRKLTDFQHKLSTKLIQLPFGRLRFAPHHQGIKHMTRRAKRKRVRQKAGLNRSILAQSWGSFRTLLEWKGAAAGVFVERVEPAYTSQTCSRCGVVDAASRQSQAVYVCTTCGFSLNADHNAARNIRAAGLSSLKARGVRVSPRTASVGVGGGR